MQSEKLPYLLTSDILSRIGGPVPKDKVGIRRAHTDLLAEKLPPLMVRFEIDQPLRVAHFLAQLAHESDSFVTMEEYASGAAYEGRADLGNIHQGDGKRFKGRGPIQLTGRGNHRAFTAWMRKNVSADAPDFEGRPELVIADRWVAYSAIYFWTSKNLNKHADGDDILAVTRIINGGRNGLDDRKVKLSRARAEIAALLARSVMNDPARPAVYRGLVDNPYVERLQFYLNKAGYALGVDGDFGPATQLALTDWQRRNGLTATGIADRDTWARLEGS